MIILIDVNVWIEFPANNMFVLKRSTWGEGSYGWFSYKLRCEAAKRMQASEFDVSMLALAAGDAPKQQIHLRPEARYHWNPPMGFRLSSQHRFFPDRHLTGFNWVFLTCGSVTWDFLFEDSPAHRKSCSIPKFSFGDPTKLQMVQLLSWPSQLRPTFWPSSAALPLASASCASFRRSTYRTPPTRCWWGAGWLFYPSSLGLWSQTWRNDLMMKDEDDAHFDWAYCTSSFKPSMSQYYTYIAINYMRYWMIWTWTNRDATIFFLILHNYIPRSHDSLTV